MVKDFEIKWEYFSVSENTVKESSVITEKNLCKADTAQDSDEQCFIKTVSPFSFICILFFRI